MTDKEKIEAGFHKAMLDIYYKAGKECRYYARRYLQLVRNRGGLEAAKKLLKASGLSPGFLKLKECGRLDLTFEHLILQPEWKDLFTDEERYIAKNRLQMAKGYSPENFPFYCDRFKDFAKEGLFEHSEGYDETEWFIPNGVHIYYCPFCGTYIAGEGFGEAPKPNIKE